MRVPHTLMLALLVLPGAALAQELPEGPEDFPAELEAESTDLDFVRLPNPAFPSPEVRAVPVDRGPKIERADLAPYFGEGKLKDALEAYRRRDFDKARGLLNDEKETAPVRYLRAIAAFDARDFRFAGPELEKLAEAFPGLEDRCLVLAGQAFEELNDAEGAARVYGQVNATSRMAADAALGLARSKSKLKQHQAARDALKDWVDRPPPPWGRDLGAEALYALLGVEARAGKKKAEQDALMALWSKHPLSKFAKRVEARVGPENKAPTPALVDRAEALVDAHQNAQGLALVEPLLDGLKLPDKVACQAHFTAGKAQRKLRKHAKAIALLDPVVKKCADADLKVKARYLLGFSQGIVQKWKAPATYVALAHEAPGHAYADDALFFAAQALLAQDKRDEAVDRLLEVVEHHGDGDHAADALFTLFWMHREQQRWPEALVFLEEIEGRFANPSDSYERERAGYWHARTLEAMGQPKEAIAKLSQLAVDHPATYYGLIARERVTALDAEAGKALAAKVAAAKKAADPFPMAAGPLAEDPQFLSAVELLRLGLGEQVPLEVLAIDRTGLPPESVRLLVQVLSLSGQERAAHGLARLWLRRDLSGPITTESRSIWEIAYPQAFRELVEAHCKAANELDPDLLQALMREESALDPKALSWAGALGLCQLMPATAAEVAGKLKLKRPTKAALLEPDLNIRLGSKYLSDLVKQWKGVKQYALGSYNAGATAVKRWQREHPEEDVDAWVENIPLQETRGYVKRVLRSYNTYKLLYAPGDLPQTGPVPAVRAINRAD